MPALLSSNVIEIRLPSSTDDDPAIVKMDVTISGSQGLALADAKSKSDAMVNLIAKAISEWNFTTKEGIPEPITEQTVSRLCMEDFTALAERLGESVEQTIGKKHVGSDEKKD